MEIKPEIKQLLFKVKEKRQEVERNTSDFQELSLEQDITNNYIKIEAVDIDGNNITVYVDNSQDVIEDKWYFSDTIEVQKNQNNTVYYIETELEERGTDENLDDWLYTRQRHRPPSFKNNRRSVGGGGVGGLPGTGGGKLFFSGGNQLRNLAQDSVDSNPQAEAMGMSTFQASAETSESVDNVQAQPAADYSVDSGVDDSEKLGMATGGHKDFNNPRDNIRNGKVPTLGSLSPEGLFYDYYFDTGSDDPKKDSLFYPSYSRATSKNPVTGEFEDYIAVGLNSNIKADTFQRPTLDLVVVLDISGSMGSNFDEYHYDQQKGETERKAKIEAAKKALHGVIDNLKEDDRLGVILYDNNAYRAKPLRGVGHTDVESLHEHINELEDAGGTNLSTGAERGIEMFKDVDSTGREKRMVFLTDHQPNKGKTGVDELVQLFDDAAQEHNIYTTFVGVGIGTNAELGEKLSKVRGANHVFIHNSDEFEQRLADEFDYLVTPLVFDLSLEINVEGFEVEQVYGAPSNTEELLQVSTLFPSPPDESGDKKGSIILVKLQKTDETTEKEISLKASWETRDGETNSDVIYPDFDTVDIGFYENTGIRKGVALVRYASVLEEWVKEVRENSIQENNNLVGMEHQSVDIELDDSMRQKLENIRGELVDAMRSSNDETFEQEIEIIDTLLAH